MAYRKVGANKKLGIDPHSILGSLFPQPGASVAVAINGQIPRLDFLGFWTTIALIPHSEANPLLDALCSQLQSRLRLIYAPRDEKASKSKSKSKDQSSDFDLVSMLENNSYVNVNGMVTTLAFLLFTPFKFNPRVLAEWYNNFQRSDYAFSVPDSVKNLATFIKFRCLLNNVGWDDTEFKYDDKDKRIFNIQFQTMKDQSQRDGSNLLDPNGDIFSSLISAASRIITTSQIPLLALDETDLGSNECGFIYTYLHDIIYEFGKDYHSAILSSLFDRAHVISQGGAQSIIREQSFLAICHMVRSFFTIDAVTNITILRRGLLILQNFYMWQQPYGKLAEQLIMLIQYELLCPGYSFRQLLLRESQLVDYQTKTDNVNTSIANRFYNTKAEDRSHDAPHNGYTYNKPIFYLYETTDKHAYSLLSVIDPLEFSPDNVVSAVPDTNTLQQYQVYKQFAEREALKAQSTPTADAKRKSSVVSSGTNPLLASIEDEAPENIPPHPVLLMTILHALNTDAPFSAEEVPAMKYLTREQVIIYYYKVLNFHKTLLSLHPAPTVGLRREEIVKLKKEIVDTALESRRAAEEAQLGPSITTLPQSNPTHCKFQPTLPNTDHIHLPIESSPSLGDHPGFPCAGTYDKMLNLLQSFVPNNVPRRRSVSYLQQSLHSQNNPNNSSQSNQYESSTTRETSVSHQDMNSRLSMMDRPSILTSSRNDVLGKDVLETLQRTKRIIRFAIMGSARFLHRVVTSYQKIQINHPYIFDYVDLHFFVLPTHENYLCNYLARNDMWFYRHIYVPFLSPALLLPWIRDEDASGGRLVTQSTAIGQSYPCQYLRSCVIQYAQQALYTLPCTIYKVECSNDPRATEIAATLYFIQRFELGLSPAIDDFRASNPQYATLRNDEITALRNFSFTSLDMAIAYSKCDLLNASQAEVLEEGVQFQSLILSNIPSKTTGTTIAQQTLRATEQEEKDAKSKKNKDEKGSQLPEIVPSTSNQQGDYTSIPDPTSTTLELFINAPRVDKSKIRTGSLLADPRQHISDLSCTSMTPFKIRVDGALYGPFKYIHISPATTSFGQLAKFPVRTFAPLAE